MRYVYDSSVSPRQRHLIEQAISYCTYPLDLLDITATFTVVDEPSCPGHQDYMCTTETVTGHSGTADVQIRTGADDPKAPVNFLNGRRTNNEVEQFFMESIIHELGHCVTFDFIQDDGARTTAAQLFHKSGPTGEGTAQGALADWNPLTGKWEDRIQEAVAEVFKDTYLADQYRLYDNRTNWDLNSDDHANLMRMLLPPNTNSFFEGYQWMPGDFLGTSSADGGTPEFFFDWSPSFVQQGHWYRNAIWESVQGPGHGEPGPGMAQSLEGYDPNQPLKVALSYGNQWRNFGDHPWQGQIPDPTWGTMRDRYAWEDIYPHNAQSTYPSCDYTLHAEISDKRNGKFWEFDVHVDGTVSDTVLEQEIRPPHPVDLASLKGIIRVAGLIPAMPNVVTSGSPPTPPSEVVNPARGWIGGFDPIHDGIVRNGQQDWGAFMYYSTNVQDKNPEYPYKQPSIEAQAKAQMALNLARARAALR